MALLLGNETIEAAQAASESGQILAQQFECVTAGTMDTFHLRNGTTVWGAGSISWWGVYADNAGLPGTVLEQVKVEVNLPVSEWTTVAGFNLVLSKGTKYWLAVVCTNKKARTVGKSGGSSVTCKKSTKLEFAKLETTSEWGNEAKGPLSFFGTGTESGGAQTLPFQSAISGTSAVLALAVGAGVTVPLAGAVASTAATGSLNAVSQLGGLSVAQAETATTLALTASGQTVVNKMALVI